MDLLKCRVGEEKSGQDKKESSKNKRQLMSGQDEPFFCVSTAPQSHGRQRHNCSWNRLLFQSQTLQSSRKLQFRVETCS